MRSRRQALPKGEFTADVVALDHEGRGIARIDGKVTFIADALPGERVRFTYTSQMRDRDEGQVRSVELASADRVEPACPHFGICGGCVLQHLAADKQIEWKQKELLDALQRIGNIKPQTVAPALLGPSFGYRRRARLGVKFVPKKGGTLVGFRERNSQYLAAIESCQVLDPRLGNKLTTIARMIDQLSIREKIPQIEAAIGEHVALIFRVLITPTEADLGILHAFATEHDFDVYLQPGGLSSTMPLTPPARHLQYSPDGGPNLLQFEPHDFIQVNSAVSQSMIRQALDWLALPKGARVLELFAGLGNFTVPFGLAGYQMTAIEGEHALVERGQRNCEAHRLDVLWKVSDLFMPDPQISWLKAPYDAIVLDPPRAGAQELSPVLAKMRVPLILYISCHPGTLARDAAVFAAAGYQLLKAGVMDMFPHTGHVESMALFERKPCR